MSIIRRSQLNPTLFNFTFSTHHTPGWADQGVDPAEYSWRIMTHCGENAGNKSLKSAQDILAKAQDTVSRGRMLLGEFRKQVPGQSDAPYYGAGPLRTIALRSANPFATVPFRERLSMVRGALASLLPGYDHVNQPLPDWAAVWFDHWARGEDMTMFYGVRPSEPAA